MFPNASIMQLFEIEVICDHSFTGNSNQALLFSESPLIQGINRRFKFVGNCDIQI